MRKLIVPREAVFDPEALHAMALAFEDACQQLGLAKTDCTTDVVAARLIQGAAGGERDPRQLTRAVLESFGLEIEAAPRISRQGIPILDLALRRAAGGW